jgi:bacterioferritin-associated ferredoxin
MIICSCNVFSDAEVRDVIDGGSCPQTPGAVYKCLGCSPSCGRCLAAVRAILNEHCAGAAIKEGRRSARIDSGAHEIICTVGYGEDGAPEWASAVI